MFCLFHFTLILLFFLFCLGWWQVIGRDGSGLQKGSTVKNGCTALGCHSSSIEASSFLFYCIFLLWLLFLKLYHKFCLRFISPQIESCLSFLFAHALFGLYHIRVHVLIGLFIFADVCSGSFLFTFTTSNLFFKIFNSWSAFLYEQEAWMCVVFIWESILKLLARGF